MDIKTAIEKAVEGGYHRGQIGTSPIVEINCDFAITETKGERNHYGLAWVWLDPLFWQSLGEAMVWGKKCFCQKIREMCHPRCEEEGYAEGWEIQWHRFIDHLAEGRTAESFFESL